MRVSTSSLHTELRGLEQPLRREHGSTANSSASP